jgi:UDP-N-acetylglucosamine 1-carboxyvinyltransferase
MYRQTVYFIYYKGNMAYFEIQGGKSLSGEITVNGSKNSAVAILAASLLNHGKTTLKNVPNIEEVNRWCEVLESMGVDIQRDIRERKMVLRRPKELNLQNIQPEAAQKTRSSILLLGALSGEMDTYKIPQSGGCKLGKRTIQPHVYALESFGITIQAEQACFRVDASAFHSGERVVLFEMGDTVTENAILAAAQAKGRSTIRFSSANYMVQDLCYFLECMGIKISGIGTSVLEIEGLSNVDTDVVYEISEDPIEAMFFVAIAATTNSEISIQRVPIDFVELELLKLKKMGFSYELTPQYLSKNNKTSLVDITTKKSQLIALEEKIHPLPYPGINMDNLPFFVPIACRAKGRTLIHDWVYENRAIYFPELNRLGANITLLDPHRVYVEGPREFVATDMKCPPALRPAATILVAMLAAKGVSTLKDIYAIQRGYENLEERLQKLGAEIERKS